MEKEFVPYELALRIKQLGFDEPCFGFYDEWDNNKPIGGNYPCDGINSAPTWHQAFRWFREKRGLYHNINKHGYWFFEIKKDEGFGDLTNVSIVFDFESYEETETACLEKLIEIVEQKDKEDETN
jgi:hypothetical protein